MGDQACKDTAHASTAQGSMAWNLFMASPRRIPHSGKRVGELLQSMLPRAELHDRVATIGARRPYRCGSAP
jgi:hypothetical protein